MHALMEERLQQYEAAMLCSASVFMDTAKANDLNPTHTLIPFEAESNSLREALEKNKALVDMAASRCTKLSGVPATFQKAQDAVDTCKGPKFCVELAFLKAVDDAQIRFLTAGSRWLANVKICAATDAFKAAHSKNRGLEEIVGAATVDALEALKKKVEDMHEIASRIDSGSLLGLRVGHSKYVEEAKTLVDTLRSSLSGLRP